VDVTSAIQHVCQRAGKFDSFKETVLERETTKRKLRYEHAKGSGWTLIPFVLVAPYAKLSPLALKTLRMINNSSSEMARKQNMDMFYEETAASLTKFVAERVANFTSGKAKRNPVRFYNFRDMYTQWSRRAGTQILPDGEGESDNSGGGEGESEEECNTQHTRLTRDSLGGHDSDSSGGGSSVISSKSSNNGGRSDGDINDMGQGEGDDDDDNDDGSDGVDGDTPSDGSGSSIDHNSDNNNNNGGGDDGGDSNSTCLNTDNNDNISGDNNASVNGNEGGNDNKGGGDNGDDCSGTGGGIDKDNNNNISGGGGNSVRINIDNNDISDGNSIDDFDVKGSDTESRGSSEYYSTSNSNSSGGGSSTRSIDGTGDACSTTGNSDISDVCKDGRNCDNNDNCNHDATHLINMSSASV